MGGIINPDICVFTSEHAAPDTLQSTWRGGSRAAASASTCGGWIDGHGRGTLHQLSRGFNQHAYIALLLDELLSAVRGMRQTSVLFQQDHSPVLMARLVRSMLEEEDDLEVVPWLVREPDMNSIENVWGRMTDILAPKLRDRQVREDELWEAIQAAWEEVTPTYCRTLAESVPRRLQAVVDAAGDWSPYKATHSPPWKPITYAFVVRPLH